MIFLGILFFLMSASFAGAMDASDFYEESAGIVSVPTDKFRQYASALSDEINDNMNDGSDEGAADFSDLQWQPSVAREDKTDADEEEQKKVIFKEHKAIFMKCEEDIYQSVCLFLRDRQYEPWLQMYANLISKQKKLPSHAAVAVAELMLQDTHYEYSASQLLEYVLSKLSPSWNWNDAYGYEHSNVERDICRALAPYFRDTFNSMVETTHPSEPTAPLYTALRKCVRYLASDPDQSWDDIECSWSYMYEFGLRHLKKMALWYLDRNRLPHQLQQTIDLPILSQATAFFETTSYGLCGSRYDLLHLLRERNFICFEATNEQHVWIKYPYQVRVKKTGEVTAALIEDDPLKHKLLYGSLKISTIETRKKSHEVLKISSDGQNVAIVPAFFKEDRFKKMWNEKSNEAKRKALMNRAHHWIENPYFYFDRVTKLLQPPAPAQNQTEEKSKKIALQRKKK